MLAELDKKSTYWPRDTFLGMFRETIMFSISNKIKGIPYFLKTFHILSSSGTGRSVASNISSNISFMFHFPHITPL